MESTDCKDFHGAKTKEEPLNLNEIEKKVSELAEIINASVQFLPTFGYSNDLGHPHVEIINDEYQFVVVERGTEFKRKSSNHLSDLLYWIFKAITFSMAVQFELENRIANQDPRILLFSKQIELISKIDSEFEGRLRKDIDTLLNSKIL